MVAAAAPPPHTSAQGTGPPGQTVRMRLDQWQRLGTHLAVGDDEVFVVDMPCAEPTAVPVVVLHGFPTSSVDWAPVAVPLSAQRRVVLFDMPGFGLSSKPDRPYGIASAADAAVGVLERLGLGEFDLVSHDMGDTVAGELLARDLEGSLSVQGSRPTIRRRVLTNGSIYLEMAKLTDGQHMLWSAPDEPLPDELTPNAEAMEVALAATMAPPGSPASRPDPEDVRAAADGVSHDGGARLLPRLIRYLSDRRDNEARFTGAIEDHPAPLGIVWGDLDPIAVVDMAHRLTERRPDATLTVLEGIGHYPMLEAPGPFSRELLARLDA